MIALALTLLATSSVASAQEIQDDRFEEGRALYQAGLVAAEAERWADARRSFDRAYALTHLPSALFNLALAHRALGQPVAASEALEELLVRDDIDDELRGRAARLLSIARAEVAELVLIGLAPEHRYEIAVEGRLVADRGDRPLTVSVDPGLRALVVRRGADRWRWTGELSPGETETVEPFPTADDGTIFESPWLWVIVGVAVAGGVVAAILVGSDDGLDRSGRYVQL